MIFPLWSFDAATLLYFRCYACFLLLFCRSLIFDSAHMRSARRDDYYYVIYHITEEYAICHA